MSETRLVLRGSQREALKIVAWLAVAELFAAMNSGWPTGVVIALVAFIAFVPALGAEMRGLLMVGAVVGVTVVFARLALDQRFALASVIYAGLAAAVLTAPGLGGAQLAVDRQGAAVTQFWATRRFAWSEASPELLADLSGKPVAVVLAPLDADKKPYYLPDRYGFSPTDLLARINQARA
jgi:hypothetical protein